MSKIIDTVIETAQDLNNAGIMNDITLREFEAFKLTPVKKYTANDIKHIRQQNKVSQSVFAAYLNTSLSTIQQWEQNKKHPRGIALKLLSLIEKQGLEILA